MINYLTQIKNLRETINDVQDVINVTHCVNTKHNMYSTQDSLTIQIKELMVLDLAQSRNNDGVDMCDFLSSEII